MADRANAAREAKSIPVVMSGIATSTPPSTIYGISGTIDVAMSAFTATAEIRSPILTPFHAASSIAHSRPINEPSLSSNGCDPAIAHGDQ